MTKTCCEAGRAAYPRDCPVCVGALLAEVGMLDPKLGRSPKEEKPAGIGDPADIIVDGKVIGRGTLVDVQVLHDPDELFGPEPVLDEWEHASTAWSASAVRYFRWGKCSTEGCDGQPKYEYWFEKTRAQQPFGACEGCAETTRRLLGSFGTKLVMRRL